jgi:hypothetical protein
MSKSEAIRQFFKEHPNATNTEVVDGLQLKGIEVNANLVNQVRHDYKHKKAREAAMIPDDNEPLLKVKRLADELGGLDRLIQHAFLLKRLFGGDEEVTNGSSQECEPDGRAEACP